MMEDAAGIPFVFAFGVPSCVPASPFETSGAAMGLAEMEALFDEQALDISAR